jgi:polyisoprenoid-binding protein YceI
MTTATATATLTGAFQADAAHSSVEAGTRHMGVGSFRTRFDDVSARLIAGEDSIRLEGEARVESIGIRTPDAFREHVVYGEDFFDARRFPVIRFSGDVELREDGAVTVRGELTIKDRTRPITARGAYREPVEDPYGGVRTGIDVAARIDRREFGLDWQAKLPGGGDVLGWEVDIDVRLELVR